MTRFRYDLGIFLFLTCFVTANAFAGQFSATIEFPSPDIKLFNGYHQIVVPDAYSIGEPGSPSLPASAIWMLLPPGFEALDVTLDNQIWEEIEGEFLPEPIQPPHAFSDPVPPLWYPPDESIYNGNAVHPSTPVGNLQTHLKRGYAVSSFLVTTVRWNPTDGALQWLVSADINMESEPSEKSQNSFTRFYRGDRKTADWIEGRIINNEDMSGYPRRDNEDEPEGILIVTIDDYLDIAEDYAEWWSFRGRRGTVVTCEALTDEFDGEDDAECIREGIIYAYEEWNIGYVMLLGDTRNNNNDNNPNIPHRGFRAMVNNGADNNIPADIYYGGLDGSWNDDGDNIWGEPAEDDLMVEVHVGRIPASSEEQAEMHINKVKTYSETPVDEDIMTVMMAGEFLGWNNTGGDYMDEVFEGSDSWGYSTAGFPEDDYTRYNLYDRENQWSGNTFCSRISRGYHFVHHLGHAFTNQCFKLNAANVSDDQIENDGVDNGYNIAYSQGCYAGAFDNRGTGANQFGSDCIGEVLTTHLEDGFVAFLANSRYGWGSGANTNGASQRFQRQFVDAQFNEDFYILGEINADSKEDIAPFVSNNAGNDVMRWCYYEINLLGDPAMDVWMDEPDNLNIEYDGAITLGDDWFIVTVNNADAAAIVLSRDGEILDIAQTDGNGDAILDFPEPVEIPGTVQIDVIAHNFKRLTREINVIPHDSGYPWVDMLMIDDEGGRENSLADAGETIVIMPLVRNLGGEPLEDLSAEVAINDRYVEVTERECEFPNVDPEETTIAGQGATVRILPNIPDLHEVIVTVNFTDAGGNEWNIPASFFAHAPRIESTLLEVNDREGNDNNRLDADEEAEILLTISNAGTGGVDGLTATLDCTNPMVEILEAEADLDALNAHEDASFEQYFKVKISEDCPNPYRAVFYIRLRGELDYRYSLLTSLPLSSTLYNFENDSSEWDHEPIEEGDRDQWHVSDTDNHSRNGSNSIKVGEVRDGRDYDNMMNCVMYMPELEINLPTELHFWHRMDVEQDTSRMGRAFDGGFLEARINDGDWETIEPATPEGDGYTYRIRHKEDRQNPLDENQRCFSGNFDWRQETFNLNEYIGGSVQIRFHFGTDQANRASDDFQGWWIDDISLRTPVASDPPENLQGEMNHLGATLTWDSPYIRRDYDPFYDNDLIGYRIWRGLDWDIDMLDTLVRDNSYFDNLVGMERGDYTYTITAEYATTESEFSDFLNLFWANEVNMRRNSQPSEWALNAVYPNPFNSIARISYSVAEFTEMQLTVHDLHGRIVAAVVSGKHSPGTYHAMFDASDLPAGIYMIKLQTAELIRSSKLVLVK